MTEVSDREKEEFNIRQALTACGYPEWTVNKVKQQNSKPKSKPPTRKKPDSDKRKSLVVVPYGARFIGACDKSFKKTWLLYCAKTPQDATQFVSSSEG